MKLAALVISIFLVSCSSLLIPMITDKSVKDHIKVLESGEKKIVYLPTVHVGKQPYYNEIKSIVDSLREDGYKIYYEGVVPGDTKNEMQEDTVRRKFRKLTGIHLTEYKDPDNQTLPQGIGKKYIIQTQENTGVDQELDSMVDLSMLEIINRFEAEEGEIKLLECDFSTALNEKYKCKDKEFMSPSNARFLALFDYRDDYVCDQLIESKDNKILLLFGKRHWIWIYGKLVNQNNFVLTQGKF